MAVSSSIPAEIKEEQIEKLQQWVIQTLEELELEQDSTQAFAWQKLSGDAGFRQYFRLQNSKNILAVYAPPVSEDNLAFVKISEFMRKHGLTVPTILAKDYENGFLLIEDLGSTLYWDHLIDENADESPDTLYGEAIMSLIRLQESPLDYSVFPQYDEKSLMGEMKLFSEWFVPQLLDYQLSEDEQALLNKNFKLLCDSALEQPKVVVHRDFHSRNIVYCSDRSPGIIDFQDAVIGPVTYDLVSLFKDCYVSWDEDQVKRWAIAYANIAIDTGILPPVSEQQFLRWFDWMGLQRHIKVLGIFARLYLRDGKVAYLKHLPLVIEYVRQAAQRYDELQEFNSWFNDVILPIAQQQDWMMSPGG